MKKRRETERQDRYRKTDIDTNSWIPVMLKLQDEDRVKRQSAYVVVNFLKPF